MRERVGRTRPVLIAIGVIAVGIVVVADGGIIERAWDATRALMPDRVALLVAAVALVLGGQALRAARTKLVIDQAYRSGARPHVGALAIGYLLNAAFPFRVGELVRSWLLARKLRVSLLYTVTAVILERVLDVIAVSVVLLIVLAASATPLPAFVAVIAAVSLALAVGALLLIVLLVADRPLTGRLISAVTEWLSEPLKRRIQYSVWSVVYGFQRFAKRPRLVLSYALMFVSSWTCLLGAGYLVFTAFVPGETSPGEASLATVSPFVIASSSLGWPLASEFVNGLDDILASAATVAPHVLSDFSSAVWVVLVLPVALIGFAWVFFFSVRDRSTPADISAELPDPSNKLERLTPGFDKLPEFVGAWLQGGELMRVLHQLEVSGDMSLVRVFKGGSNAITVLARNELGDHVRKIVPSREKPKLQMQYDWLVRYDGRERLVRPIEQREGDGWYSIAIGYTPTTQPMFSAIHTRPLAVSIALIDDVWQFMHEEIYHLSAEVARPDVVEAYIADRLVDRVRGAAQVHPDLMRMLAADVVVVNGRALDGFDRVMSRIRACDAAWKDLATYRESDAIHGDLTIDNILVDRIAGDFLIIDPSDDNVLRGPVLDAARMMQSLDYGYEFLNEDSAPVAVLDGSMPGRVEVAFAQRRSSQYADLAHHMRSDILPRLFTPSERRAIPFHVGLFYGRMLSHRVVIDAGNAAKYFAVSLQSLNHFIGQYDEESDDVE